jgi:hypothetical protein
MAMAIGSDHLKKRLTSGNFRVPRPAGPRLRGTNGQPFVQIERMLWSVDPAYGHSPGSTVYVQAKAFGLDHERRQIDPESLFNIQPHNNKISAKISRNQRKY